MDRHWYLLLRLKSTTLRPKTLYICGSAYHYICMLKLKKFILFYQKLKVENTLQLN